MAPSKVAPANGPVDINQDTTSHNAPPKKPPGSPLGGPPEIPVESTIDPFTAQTVHPEGLYEIIKTIVMLPIFLIRVVFILASLLLGYSWALLVLTGVKDTKQPYPWWRGKLLYGTRLCARGVLFGLGYHWIPTKGKLAPREIAPIVVGNHMSFTEPVFFFFRLLPAIVSAKQHESMPIIGTIIKAMQTISVDRSSSESRYAAAGAVKRKAMDNIWPRVLLFPEGCTTNGKGLATFKAGGFRPLLPVQPVAIKYPYVHYDGSWADPVAPSIFYLAFRMMTQVHNFMSVEYLPVIHPTSREKRENDYMAFAERVRWEIAKACNVALTGFTYADCQLGMRARAKKLASRIPSVFIEFGKFEKLYDLNVKIAYGWLDKFGAASRRKDGVVTRQDFQEYIGLGDRLGMEMFNSLFDLNGTESINFREYVAGLCFITRHPAFDSCVGQIVQQISGGAEGPLSEEAVVAGLRKLAVDADDKQLARLGKLITSTEPPKEADASHDAFTADRVKLFFERNPDFLAAFVHLKPELLERA